MAAGPAMHWLVCAQAMGDHRLKSCNAGMAVLCHQPQESTKCSSPAQVLRLQARPKLKILHCLLLLIFSHPH